MSGSAASAGRGQAAALRPQPPTSRAARAARNARYTRLIPDLRPGEGVVVLLHRHPIVLLRALAWPILLFMVWVASLLFVPAFLVGLQVDPLITPNAPPGWLAPALWLGWFGLAALLVLWLAYDVLDWRADWLALTTRRIIMMDKKLFVRETRREAPLGKVQNVIAEYPNALAVAFDFGDLQVDTAGVGTLSFKSLPRPKVMREAIFGQQKVTQANQPPPEDRRLAAVRSLILGQELPGGGQGTKDEGRPRNTEYEIRNTSNPKSGLGLFNIIFPHAPQRDGARVTWHKHWSFLVRGVALPVLVYGMVLGAWLASAMFGEPGVVRPFETLFGWLALALLPFCLGWAVWDWEDWRNDLYRLDHERVYHIESLPFGLREQSKETLITRISDVMYVVSGPVAGLLDYGNVVIKTPGEATEFDFAGIPCPREVQQEIMERVDQYRQKSAASADREIEAWLKAYHDVMGET